jgi:serine/threonine-protein kinase
VEPPAGTRVVSVARTSAKDYDPLGDDEEHTGQAHLAVDRDIGTAWSTETYSQGLEGAPKEGVGIYVDAKPGVEATRLDVQTPAPGWRAEVFAAPPGGVPESIESGWTRLGGGLVRREQQRFTLDTGGERHRYYLVWITKLPPEESRVEISELTLLASSED